MKYIYYTFILFTVMLRRVVFPLIFIVIPFRKYLRNTVYNYHLNNNIILKRLWERKPKLSGKAVNNNYWVLDGGSHSSCKGLVKRRNITKLEYYTILPMWLLLDDDSNEDTYDKGFNQTIIEGKRKPWMPKFIVKSLKEANDKAYSCEIRGNSFDLGDKRAECPLFDFWATFWWTLRNPAYNFNYKFQQLCKPELAFKVVVVGRVFGWLEDGKLGELQTYSWEFGRKVEDE